MQINRIDKVASRYQLGRICSLAVLRLVSIGAYLEWDNEDGILLPIRYLPDDVRVGDVLNVFVYHDNEGRLISTTLQPYAVVGQVALLDCVSLSSAGAFLDWGIHKDVFVPFAEQQSRMQEGKSYLVYLYIDRVSGKIVGSAKLSKHIGNQIPEYRVGVEVSIVVAERNDVGYRVVVDNAYWGIVYYDSVDDELYKGNKHKGFVIRTRDDGRLDISLRPLGYNRTDGDTAHIMELLRRNNGKLAIGDKSTADEVMVTTGLSKKSFKMAVGRLYKERKVALSPYSVELVGF